MKHGRLERRAQRGTRRGAVRGGARRGARAAARQQLDPRSSLRAVQRAKARALARRELDIEVEHLRLARVRRRVSFHRASVVFDRSERLQMVVLRLRDRAAAELVPQHQLDVVRAAGVRARRRVDFSSVHVRREDGGNARERKRLAQRSEEIVCWVLDVAVQRVTRENKVALVPPAPVARFLLQKTGPNDSEPHTAPRQYTPSTRLESSLLVE